MKNYKDETITKLCNLINCFEDAGLLLDEDKAAYRDIIADYVAEYKTEEALDAILPLDCSYCSNCYILRSNEDGEVIVKSYEDDKAEIMMRDVSKQICFSDCDDTYEVIKIVYHGREIYYTGWQPGMVMEYKFTATGDDAWSGVFPNYDH